MRPKRKRGLWNFNLIFASWLVWLCVGVSALFWLLCNTEFAMHATVWEKCVLTFLAHGKFPLRSRVRSDVQIDWMGWDGIGKVSITHGEIATTDHTYWHRINTDRKPWWLFSICDANKDAWDTRILTVNCVVVPRPPDTRHGQDEEIGLVFPDENPWLLSTMVMPSRTNRSETATTINDLN